MIIQKKRYLLYCSAPFFIILLLSGCPWGEMKYYPDETASAYMNGDSLCFLIPNGTDYEPVIISINLRSTPPKERSFIDKPLLKIVEGQLCIPPSFYHFPDSSQGPFIIEFVLQSQNKNFRPRSFVIGFEMINRRAYDIPLTDMEISRPYNEMNR